MAVTVNQSVPGEEQFCGVPDAGMVFFPAGEMRSHNPVIYSLGFNPGDGCGSWSVSLEHPKGAGFGAVELASGKGEDGFSLTEARIVVPKESDNVAFRLIARTHGKKKRGALSVTYGAERISE